MVHFTSLLRLVYQIPISLSGANQLNPLKLTIHHLKATEDEMDALRELQVPHTIPLFIAYLLV